MRTFLVENTRKGTKIKVTLNQPPYENENILYKTNYNEKDCIITEVFCGYDEELIEPSTMDNKHIGEDDYDSNKG